MDCCSGIGQRLVSNCIVHHLSFLGCYFFFCCIIFLLQLLLFLVSSVFYFTLVIKLFLSQPTSFTFFSPLSSSSPHWQGEGGSGCMVLSCWLGLNHDTLIAFSRFYYDFCGTCIKDLEASNVQDTNEVLSGLLGIQLLVDANNHPQEHLLIDSLCQGTY